MQLRAHNLDPAVLKPALSGYFALLDDFKLLRAPARTCQVASSATGQLEGHRLTDKEHWLQLSLRPANFCAAAQQVGLESTVKTLISRLVTGEFNSPTNSLRTPVRAPPGR